MHGKIRSMPEICIKKAIPKPFSTIHKYNLCGFPAILSTFLGEKLHHFWIQLSHHDLDGLIRFHVGSSGKEFIQRVEGVQVPAVPVQRSQTISGSIREHFVQKRHFLLKTPVGFQLQIRPFEILPRVEKVL